MFQNANPFGSSLVNNGSLEIKNSYLDFFLENQLITNYTLCDEINRNELIVSLFDSFKRVSLQNNMTYPIEFCPVPFKFVKLDTLEVYFLKSGNKLNFMQIPINDSNSMVHSVINTFKIYNSDIYLNNQLMYSPVFSKTKSLIFYASTLFGIQSDLFASFSSLKYIELELLNFDQFIRTDVSWMKYLNVNVTVDLTNQTDVNNNRENQMLLVLRDIIEKYEFPDQDFCLFRNFPHQKLVFPIINSKPNLDCNCTLLYLIQNKNLAVNGSQMLSTPSTKNCISSPNFDQVAYLIHILLILEIFNSELIILKQIKIVRHA